MPLRSLVIAGLMSLVVPLAARADEVPFHAALTGHVYFNPADGSGHADGDGVALHMGRTTVHSDIQALPEAAPCAGGFVVVQVCTLTAANGDTLILDISDVTCPTGGTKYRALGQWTVRAGTGRFAGVGGTGQLDSHPDLGTNVFVASMTGVLTGLGDDD